MRRWLQRILARLAVLGLATAACAQQVHLDNGEVLAGKVVAVAKNRVKVQLADGSLRELTVHQVDREVAADGTTRRFAAEHLPGATLSAPAQALLDRLRAGKPLELPELLMLATNAPATLVEQLRPLAASKSAAVRNSAVQTLARIATKESVRAALDAALDDASGAVWRALAPALTSGPCLGAIEALGARADVERALASKDRMVRMGAAWIATKLGSPTAIPVLATFVTDPDHHVRESAAVCLAEAGDASGAKVLLTMCKRERSPAVEANRDADAATRDLLARAARRERVHACELLGALRCVDALPALRALAKHADAEVAAAAKAAITRIEAKDAPAAGR